MKRYIFVVLFVISGLMLSACGLFGEVTDRRSDSADGVVTIGFMAQEWERQSYEPLIQTFNAENPDMRVRFISVEEVIDPTAGGPIDFEQRMRRIVSAADTAAVYGISSTDIAQGYLFDLRPLLDADPNLDRTDFFPSAINAVSQNDGLYMLPHTVNVVLMAYNKDLWESNNLPPPDPNWSWNDMIGAAEQIARTSGTTVDVYGLLDWGDGFLALLGELDAAGLNPLFIPADQIDLERPEIAAALERVVALAQKGAIYTRPADNRAIIDSDMMRQLILDQRVGIWQADMLNVGPTISDPLFEIGMVPFPNLSLPFFANTQGYIMSSGTQHPQAAWRWLSFLSRQSPDAHGPRMMSGINELPAQRSLAEQSRAWAEMDAETRAAVQAVLERPAQPLPDWGMDSGLVFEAISGALTAALREQKPVADALREAQASLNEKIAQVRLTPTAVPDNSPIEVQLPGTDVAPAGATIITFTPFHSDRSQLRRVASEFHQRNTAIFVDIREPAFSEETELQDVMAQADCFDWYGAPPPETLGVMLDLQPLIDADAGFDLDDYPAAFLAPYRSGTALYGLPYAVRFNALQYNQTAFDNAGLDYPRIDWTLDDFLNAAQQLTVGEGEDRQYGYAVAGSHVTDILFFVDRTGASLTQGQDDNIQPTFTDPRVLEALRYYIDLLQNYSPHTELRGYQGDGFSSDTANLIFQGRVGMWLDFGGAGFFGMSGEGNQQLAMAPLPLGNRSLTTNDIETRSLHISASSAHPEACWEWFKYLTNTTALLRSYNNDVPARLSVATSPEFQAQANPGSTELLEAYLQALESAPSGTPAANILMTEALDFYWFFYAVNQALQGQSDLEQGLAIAQRLTEDYQACVRAGGEPYTCAIQVDPDYQGWQQPPLRAE